MEVGLGIYSTQTFKEMGYSNGLNNMKHKLKF
jgi:hypothetical protein